jgi:hypothetical protein
LVMKLKGINKPGPDIGRFINQTMEWILDTNVSLDDVDAIHKYIKEL